MDEPKPLLNTPTGGFSLVETESDLVKCVSTMKSGSGPIAIDTERASGYRYSGRAYLIQLRRSGSGTFLVDPIAISDQIPVLAEVLSDSEWVLHSATQDLPCLVAVGLFPNRLFDTELAGRLLGFPKVSLGTLTEEILGWRLAKEHSHVDWSIRPLSDDWLNYAALDVELLLELRSALHEMLSAQNKLRWLEEDCAQLVANCRVESPPKVDPWRSTSGIHGVRTSEGLAALRELWTTRDNLAQRLDRAPGRIVNDHALSAVSATISAEKRVLTREQLLSFERFRFRQAKRFTNNWLDAIERAANLDQSELPPLHQDLSGTPQVRYWARLRPAAANRWQLLRPKMVAGAAELNIPVENLISPHLIRDYCWSPAGEPAAQLRAGGAREWQLDYVLPLIEQTRNDLVSGQTEVSQ